MVANIKHSPVEIGRTIRKWNREFDRTTVVERVMEAFEPGADQIGDPNFLSFRGLAEGMLGDQWGKILSRHSQGVYRLQESAEAVDASSFANITGQLLIRLLMKAYESPAFIADSLVTVIPEPMSEAILGELKVPDITGPLQGPSQVQPGMPYPRVQVKEDWITLPAIEKWGYLLQITLEALAQDRTGRIADSATKLGTRLRIDREERILAVVLGLVNNFKWQDVAYNTYGTTGNWINKKTGVTVAAKTWELLNAQNQLFVQMMDPWTNKPVLIDYSKMKILCMPESVGSFNMVVNATTVNTGQISSAPATQMVGATNYFMPSGGVVTSPYARNLLIQAGVNAANTADTWYLGQFQDAFCYRQWIAPEAFTAPPMNNDEFERDVLFNLKCREAGRAGVLNPRYSSQSINS
jgi:hypothetical protein